MTITPRTVWFGFLGASLAVIAAAYGFEFLGGLKACVLCLYQRIPYGVVAGLALGALFFHGSPKTDTTLCLGFALIFGGGAALSFYHVGVEQGWFALLEACGEVEASQSIDALRESLAATRPVRCDEIAWSFFGISLAGFNLLVSVLLAALAVATAKTLRKEPTP
jgi:disulfide bond formation protein DsbB